MNLRLRPYQQEAIDAVRAAWDRKITRPVVTLPTGSGKTVIFSRLVNERDGSPGVPLILVHRDELARQTCEKILSDDPDTRVGIVKAERNDVDADVIVGSVQTLARQHRLDQLPKINRVVVDECHHAVADSYMHILHHVGSFDGVPTVGLTATLARGDRRGLGKVWEDVVYTKSTEWMIAHGYLVDVKGLSVRVPGLDFNGIKRIAGDLGADSLAAALDAANAPAVVARAYVKHAADRQGIAFTPDVASAYEFAEAFKDEGIEAAVVVGHTPTEERQLIFKRYRAGEIQMITSAMVLTEGFDMPEASCAVIARPTENAALYIQMVGRVLRPCARTGKKDALVLDVAGIAGKHKLATLADLSEAGAKPKEGETLGEALIRMRQDDGSMLDELDLRQIDLFGGSTVNWLRTKKGIWFIQTRASLFFLLRNGDETYKVGQCGANSLQGGHYHHQSIELDYGMSYIEQLAVEEDSSIASREAPWRKKRKAKPSIAQVDYATRLGIDTTDLTKVQLSDALSIHVASRLLDR